MSEQNLQLAKDVATSIVKHYIAYKEPMDKVISAYDIVKKTSDQANGSTGLSDSNAAIDLVSGLIVPGYDFATSIIEDCEINNGQLPGTTVNNVIDGLKSLPPGVNENFIETEGYQKIVDGLLGLPDAVLAGLKNAGFDPFGGGGEDATETGLLDPDSPGLISRPPWSPAGLIGGAANAGSDGATLAPRPRRRDPLVLDLDGDGLEFTNLADSQAMFDLSGDQFATRTAWLKGDDGFLVLDGNGDGVVNGIDELFGSATEGGFAELSTWDANADGKIDAGDAIFADLKIWRDLNGDGVSQNEELQSLADLGIQSIGLATTALTNPVTDAQLITEGNFTRADGTTGQVGEVLFATNATFSNYIGAVDITEEIAALPDLKGYGKMADLRIAMALDSALQATVTQAVANLNNQDFIAAFEQVL